MPEEEKEDRVREIATEIAKTLDRCKATRRQAIEAMKLIEISLIFKAVKEMKEERREVMEYEPI